MHSIQNYTSILCVIFMNLFIITDNHINRSTYLAENIAPPRPMSLSNVLTVHMYTVEIPYSSADQFSTHNFSLMG